MSPVIAVACALAASTPAWPQATDAPSGASAGMEGVAHETLRQAADDVRRAHLSLNAAMGTGNPDSPAAKQARATAMDRLDRLMDLLNDISAGPQAEAAVQAAEQARRIVGGSLDPAEVDRALHGLDQAIIELETTLLAGTGGAGAAPAAPDEAAVGGASGELDLEALAGRELRTQVGERLGAIRHVVVRNATGFPEAVLVERATQTGGDPSLVEIPWAQIRIGPDGAVVTTLSAVAFNELPATTRGAATQ